MQFPDYITYQEYAYASKHLCRSCRDFVKNYDLTISHTTFSYLFEIKKIVQFILNETVIIKNTLVGHFEQTYRDETEGEVAKHILNWVRAATHYIRELAREMTNLPVNIPTSELNSITEHQAARFQSFFALKVNSFTTEIQSISNLIKRDSVDLAENFYINYLIPALKFKAAVIEPLSFDFTTTEISKECPTLAGELIVAENAISGNLGSVTTDYVERRIQFTTRMDALIQLISLKRRYVNYIVQMESKAIHRSKVISNTKDKNVEIYKQIFSSIPVDSENRNNLRSFHSQLDGLDEDAHPQYLRRDGGIITGAIELASGATIGGISLAEHSHSGTDGSAAISSLNIDYESGRSQYLSADSRVPYSNMKLTSLDQSLLVGGGILFDATFEIEIDDEKANSYEFEILYNEI